MITLPPFIATGEPTMTAHVTLVPRASEGAAGWCVEADTADSIVARRNALAALWAARLMRLSADDAASYAAEVHAADFTSPGSDDVVHKLWYDLNRAGVPATPQAVREALSRCHREALAQVGATD
jgi:hypothetical protein